MIGLEGLTSIGGYFHINRNAAMSSMTGLENLTSIGGFLCIDNNYSLTSLTGLNNLTSIGHYLKIVGNTNLIGITGLEGLTCIGDELNINSNAMLTSLEGLDSIDANSITHLDIKYNVSLTTCEVQSICEYLAAPNGTVSIYGNAPGCNSPAEVLAACETVGVESAVQAEGFSFFPNPFNEQLTLKFCMNTPGMAVAEVFNTMGQRLAVLFNKQLPAGTHEISCSAGPLPAGIYLIILTETEGKVSTRKLVKCGH